MANHSSLVGTLSSLSASAAGSQVDPLTGAVSAGAATQVSPAPISPTAAAAPTSATAIPAGSATAGSAASVAPLAVAANSPVAPPLAAPLAVVALVAPPSLGKPLAPAGKPTGTPKPVSYASFANQFRIGLADLNHLLKLANPNKYGQVFASDVFGKSYEISGARAINSFGNNLSNAGADGQYGTADDI